jgi:3-phenylpropionate/trans-cinnamate dioxygenase ferredoxin reductase subunit
MKFSYIIVGAGLSGASAVEGIREIDKTGSILLLGKENHPPYHRPPLSKGLWTGKKKVDDIFVHSERYYIDQGVTVQLGRKISGIDAAAKIITDGEGIEYTFEKLLLATGGDPSTLSIPGGNESGVFYFRTLDDYLALSPLCQSGASALVIGGGFIGTEMAAALSMKKVHVTMLFPDSRPCFKVFPESLGLSVAKLFEDRGIQIITRDKPSTIEKTRRKYFVQSQGSRRFECDFVIAGLGITPSVDCVKRAGLDVENGIRVNALLQTSHPDIFAAGDNAVFPQPWSGLPGRIEHWDNALNQGRQAGRNMAGAHEPYVYIPYFFSDLFELGYEAVGEVDSRHETVTDWQEENKKGVIYYLKENTVVGVLLCNIWEKVDQAREMIKKNTPVDQKSLHGAIR